MTVQATLMTDGNRAPTLRRTARGWEGRRCYEVNTHEEERAIEAMGVPRLGDVWSGARAVLACVDVSCRYLYGADIAGTGEGGTCQVDVTYQSAGWGGAPVTPAGGLKYTELVTEVGTETVYSEPREEGDPPVQGLPPIANGEGMPRETVSQRVRVVTFWEPLALDGSMIRGLRGILQRVNSNLITLPPLHGQSEAARLELAPGEGRYRTFETALVGDLIQLTHDIAIAPTHDYFWGLYRADGTVIEPLNRSRRYLAANWPAELF